MAAFIADTLNFPINKRALIPRNGVSDYFFQMGNESLY
jgi:hypothetical protein